MSLCQYLFACQLVCLPIDDTACHTCLPLQSVFVKLNFLHFFIFFCPPIHFPICLSNSLSVFAFLGSGPKGPMSCRTQGGISRRPSIRPSFCPYPPWPPEPQFCSLRPDFGPPSPPPPSPPKPSLEAQIPVSRLKYQPQGPNPSLQDQIPACRLQSQPQG